MSRHIFRHRSSIAARLALSKRASSSIPASGSPLPTTLPAIPRYPSIFPVPETSLLGRKLPSVRKPIPPFPSSSLVPHDRASQRALLASLVSPLLPLLSAEARAIFQLNPLDQSLLMTALGTEQVALPSQGDREICSAVFKRDHSPRERNKGGKMGRCSWTFNPRVLATKEDYRLAVLFNLALLASFSEPLIIKKSDGLVSPLKQARAFKQHLENLCKGRETHSELARGPISFFVSSTDHFGENLFVTERYQAVVFGSPEGSPRPKRFEVTPPITLSASDFEWQEKAPTVGSPSNALGIKMPEFSKLVPLEESPHKEKEGVN